MLGLTGGVVRGQLTGAWPRLLRIQYPGATCDVMACGSHVQELFQSGLWRGACAQKGLDGVLEQGRCRGRRWRLKVRADVGSHS